MCIIEKIERKKVVIGLVHLLPLPGTPFFEDGNIDKSIRKAVADAKSLSQGGADGCLIQTVDRVYPVGDEIDYARLAAMTRIVSAVSEAIPAEFEVGVQILWNALRPALAIAKVSGGSFLRCNAFVGATITPAGVAESNPVEFQHYRARIDAQNIKLLAEVDGMHFKWLKGELATTEVARLAKSAGAHGVEVANPDEKTTLRLVKEIKLALPDLPVILGGYTNHKNAAKCLAVADGAFVGSCFETQGWGSYVDVDRVKSYVDIVSRVPWLGSQTPTNLPSHGQ